VRNMAKRFTREEIKANFANVVSRHRPVLVTTAGMGLSAKFEQKGGTDMVAVSNASVLAMDGHSPVISIMPYGNANDLVLGTMKRIVSQVEAVPLMAGICATDPTTDLVPFLKELGFYKASAVFNTPSVGMFEGDFKRMLERAEISYEQEVAALSEASARGFYTMGMAYTTEQAELMARAGVDAVICNFGFTIDPGEEVVAYLTEGFTAEKMQRMRRAVRAVNPEMLVLVHGGLLNSPEAARRILADTGAAGMLLASAVERIPVQEPLMRAVQEFKNVTLERRV